MGIFKDKLLLVTVTFNLFYFVRDFVRLKNSQKPVEKQLKSYQIFWYSLASNIFLIGLYPMMKALVFTYPLITLTNWTLAYYGVTLFVSEIITARVMDKLELESDEYMSMGGAAAKAVLLFTLMFLLALIPLMVIS